ncbi:MAG: hypothetical protein AWU57_4165 [Marinobacter sp. T13-3]|nr:MAG: hypothetical protein AWU57_4165 [Marinobacter sp. T13-3]
MDKDKGADLAVFRRVASYSGSGLYYDNPHDDDRLSVIQFFLMAENPGIAPTLPPHLP